MDLPEEFQQAVAKSKQLTKRPDNEELLELYALYKQATEGDITEDRPGGFDFKAIAKHDAWASKKGMQSEQAIQKYTAFVNELEKRYA
jgi:acyl-CoA-binding protein